MPKKIKNDWEIWEDDVASDTGGEKVRYSGRSFMAKGDVKTKTTLIDCKYTKSVGFRLCKELLDNMHEWGINESRVPVVACKTVISEFAIIPQSFYFDALDGISGPLGNIYESESQKTIGVSMQRELPVVMGIGRYAMVVIPYDDFVRGLAAYEADE